MQRMHFVVFEASSEQATGDRRDAVLNPADQAEADRLSTGDVLWIVTRLGSDRDMPALCGRLIVKRVVRGSLPAVGGTAGWTAVADPERSSRRRPFPCDAIRSWNIWRRPFAGLARLEEEQAAALETEWARSIGVASE